MPSWTLTRAGAENASVRPRCPVSPTWQDGWKQLAPQGPQAYTAQVHLGWLPQHLKITWGHCFSSPLQNKQRLCEPLVCVPNKSNKSLALCLHTPQPKSLWTPLQPRSTFCLLVCFRHVMFSYNGTRIHTRYHLIFNSNKMLTIANKMCTRVDFYIPLGI